MAEIVIYAVVFLIIVISPLEVISSHEEVLEIPVESQDAEQPNIENKIEKEEQEVAQVKPEPKPEPQSTQSTSESQYKSTDAIKLGRQMNAEKFGEQHWDALYQLWMRESGWNPDAVNRSSGACGIPQALPCSKITDQSTQGQLTWGLEYIANRYGTPTIAWQWFLSHNWY